MANNFVKLLEFGPVVQEEKLFEDISLLQLWRAFCLAEKNNYINI